MIFARWHKIFAPVILSILLFISACAPNTTSRYSQVQRETTQKGAPAAVAKTAEQGSTFNQFFPGSVRSYNIVPAQEKKGFAEYKVNKEGKTVAMLSISDVTSIPTAAIKYKNSPFTVAGYPAVDQGTTATGLLVNNRYQVKVLSRDPSFTKEDRVAWLQKFDLRGLAKLQPAKAPEDALSPKTASPKSPPILSPQPAT
ncbi:MAG: hypothetical protein JOZ78_02230 [Chroococcidiopsidaceae cyanobacterium CP_BM_ER_R8_30]|nr:hypothetical protein [Chroococcidiopsidaceae cyanobacterium CP_BM_ER_R8_30]